MKTWWLWVDRQKQKWALSIAGSRDVHAWADKVHFNVPTETELCPPRRWVIQAVGELHFEGAICTVRGEIDARLEALEKVAHEPVTNALLDIGARVGRLERKLSRIPGD